MTGFVRLGEEGIDEFGGDLKNREGIDRRVWYRGCGTILFDGTKGYIETPLQFMYCQIEEKTINPDRVLKKTVNK